VAKLLQPRMKEPAAPHKAGTLEVETVATV